MIPANVNDFPEQGADKEFAEFLRNGEFKIQLCGDCQKHTFYPRILCPHCGSQKMSWVTAAGAGTVYSSSIPRGMQEGPYNISLIDLAEGPRMLSRVVDITPEKVQIGMPVRAFIGQIENVPVVLFRPEEQAL